MREVELDHAFAEAFEASAEFRRWVLAGSRFSRHADTAQLLRDEQARARKSAKHWWKHWWSYMPDGTSSETDIFAVFEIEGGRRFALHIENKPAHGKINLRQAADYRRRAALWANDPQYLNYDDFETILIAPATFIAANGLCVAQFDRSLPYEVIGEWVPAFTDALYQAA